MHQMSLVRPLVWMAVLGAALATPDTARTENFWNPDWFPLPGQAVFDHEKQQIAAVSRAPGNLDLFVVGFDNKVWTTFWAAREPFTCAFCNDGTCQCGSRTDEELCASHSGVDPELGCIQQE